MTVKFNVVERGKPSDPGAPKKFYPSVVSSGKIGQRDVANIAAAVSTVSPADTAAVLENFLAIVAQELAKGNIVDLGDFGSFWLRIDTEGEEKAEDVRADNVTAVMVRFSPGDEFQKVLNDIKFEKQM